MQQIPGYGDQAQPALAARMTPQLRMTQVGLVAAVLSVALGAAAIYTFPNFAGAGSGRGWAVAALAAGLLMLGLCSLQLLAWTRAMAEWRGVRNYDLRGLTRLSWVAHLVSYAVVLLALWACIAGSVSAGTTATASALLAFALLFVVLAQVLGGVQYLRVSGPSGTIPAHLRRLGAAIARNR
jgi:hypothetical protein